MLRLKYLPINLSIRNRTFLVVGGGKVALRKIETLLEYNVDVTVVAPEVEDKIDYYGRKKLLTLNIRTYQSPEAKEYGLVISASDDEAVNRQVYEDCVKAGVLVNVVDNPKLCTFTFPATVQRDCLSLAISTDGKAPFLSAHLRRILEDLFPKHWEKIARLASDYRKMVQDRWGDDLEKRHAALEAFLQADWKTIINEKDKGAVQAEMEHLLDV